MSKPKLNEKPPSIDLNVLANVTGGLVHVSTAEDALKAANGTSSNVPRFN